MTALRVLIADDEEIARKRLTRLLKGIPDIELRGECADGIAVLKRVAEGDIDVMLLDIQMPGLTGLEAMALLPEDGPYTIFCTAYAEHAVAAFDVGAIDYLLKPIEGERLEKALQRARSREARERFHAELREQRQIAQTALARLAIPTQQGIVLVDPREVSHALLEGELVTIYVGGQKYFTDFSLQTLSEKLARFPFERVHRKALLNLEHVVHLEPCPTGGYVARTRTGATVEISRQSARALRKRLGLRRSADEE
ncbi:response regulator [Pendulispora brunnea]|uniref:Response regulator n=1 Tax=Pendulispora brunnea TaxID=2905690 RepID=A0ABZ2KCG1_9BACT